MADGAAQRRVEALGASADRLDDLAEVAELMGDPDGAARLRSQAARRRLSAMALLDDPDSA